MSWAWRIVALIALIVPLSLAAVLSFLPSKRYESAAWIIVDTSRGSQAFAGSEVRRAGNEVITYDQVLRTQLSIAGSEDVIRKALAAMLPTRLYPEFQVPEGTSGTAERRDGNLLQRLAGMLPARLNSDAGTLEAQLGATGREVGSFQATKIIQPSIEDREYAAAKANLSLSIEPNTFILKISFRHKDPVLAANFANALAAEFLVRRSALYSNEGDADFFKAQELRYNKDLQAAFVELEKFSRESGVFAVSEQRRLLLEARAHAAKEVANNSIEVARAESTLNALKVQIQALRGRMTLPPEIYGSANSSPAARGAVRDDTLANDPPLLHVKIYQDTAAKLVEANAELAGLRAMELRRAEDLRRIDNELSELAENEAKFNALKRAVSQAESYIENLSKRAGEAQINNASRSNEAFSSAQILQSATVPLGAVFPKPTMFLGAGAVVSAFLFISVIYFNRNIGLIRHKAAPPIGLNDARSFSTTQPSHFAACEPKYFDDVSGGGKRQNSSV